MCERRVSSQHTVKSLTLNPYMSLLNLKFEPIFVQQILILDPLTLDFLVRLGLNFHPMDELREGVDWAGDNFFCHGQKRDCLSRASQRARGATKNALTLHIRPVFHRLSEPNRAWLLVVYFSR